MEIQFGERPVRFYLSQKIIDDTCDLPLENRSDPKKCMFARALVCELKKAGVRAAEVGRSRSRLYYGGRGQKYERVVFYKTSSAMRTMLAAWDRGAYDFEPGEFYLSPLSRADRISRPGRPKGKDTGSKRVELPRHLGSPRVKLETVCLR